MNEQQDLVREVRKLREEISGLREEVFVPLSEIAKQLNRLNDAAWSAIQMVKRENKNGKREPEAKREEAKSARAED